MNLRLKNPLSGSKEPWPLILRIERFVFTAVALAFLAVSSRTLHSVVQQSAGLHDPQALPERPRRVAEWLCHVSTAFLLLGVVFTIAGRLHAIWAFCLGFAFRFAARRYLGRTAWGLTNAFHQEEGRFEKVLRRLGRVIRHGNP